MPKIAGVNHQAAVRVLQKAGFRVLRQGKHIVMTDGTRILTIPRNNPVNAYTMGGPPAFHLALDVARPAEGISSAAAWNLYPAVGPRPVGPSHSSTNEDYYETCCTILSHARRAGT